MFIRQNYPHISRLEAPPFKAGRMSQQWGKVCLFIDNAPGHHGKIVNQLRTAMKYPIRELMIQEATFDRRLLRSLVEL
ncbi:MAG: hypothetical protein CVT48_03610 [Thermoplasmata archaeon HGW-Thermoplasmata-1]|nr:MAG: hypothetical protein CVT48_03610 [Thermoplasmata archaeon HGW-Thermoplasmata-1]